MLLAQYCLKTNFKNSIVNNDTLFHLPLNLNNNLSVSLYIRLLRQANVLLAYVFGTG